MPIHGKMTSTDGGVHSLVSYFYANETVRKAGTGLTIEDIGKLACQLDYMTFWLLVGLSPCSWARVLLDEDPIVVSFAPGARNVIICTVPTPAGAGRFVLTRCIVRLSSALVGPGTVTFSIGSTSGGVQIIKATTITSATAIGVIGGEAISTLGADMAASNAYEAVYDCGQNIYANVSVAGTVTGGQVSIYLHGLFLP